MLPNTFTDKVECLEALVGVRTGCSVDKQYPFWIEDIEGVDIEKLASIAKGSNPTGADFARQLINSASREMLADLELIMNNGYTVKNILGDMCSACSLLPSYTANAGIVIKPAMTSKFKTLYVSKLSVMTNVTGSRVLKVDDGVSPKTFNVTLEAGVLMPLNLMYRTTEKFIKVYFTDPTVGLGLVSCATPSSCGCGGSVTANNPINIVGLLAGSETSVQYGFIPCAGVACSPEVVVCSLIHATPNIFGQALLFKVAEKYYLHKQASERNNEAVSFNEEEKSVYVRNYGNLYTSKLYGKTDRKGIKNIVNDYLRINQGDNCIKCESVMKTAYATG